MRLIDADKLIERINGTGYAEQIKSNLRFIVDIQPTIDAVEVVRCKDCKYKYDTKMNNNRYNRFMSDKNKP